MNMVEIGSENPTKQSIEKLSEKVENRLSMTNLAIKRDVFVAYRC